MISSNMEITSGVYKHIKRCHMLGYEKAFVKSQFMVNPTRMQLLSYCEKLTEKHLDPFHNGGSIKSYFLCLGYIVGWGPYQQETEFIRICIQDRFVKSIYPVIPRRDKLKILKLRGVA